MPSDASTNVVSDAAVRSVSSSVSSRPPPLRMKRSDSATVATSRGVGSNAWRSASRGTRDSTVKRSPATFWAMSARNVAVVITCSEPVRAPRPSPPQPAAASGPRRRQRRAAAAPGREARPAPPLIGPSGVVPRGAPGAETGELQEVVGDAVPRLAGGRVGDAVHVAGGELGDAAAAAADHGVPVLGAGRDEALTVAGPVDAAQRADLVQHLEGAVDGGEAELRALLARGVVDLERALTPGRGGDRVEHGASLAGEAQPARGESGGDLRGVEAHGVLSESENPFQ